MDALPPRSQPHCLKLLKNLYGLVDASNTWFQCLRNALLKRGFTQSRIDPCVFVKGNLIFITYVDDCILLCPDEGPINDTISSLKKEFVLTDDGDLSAYLGIKVTKNADGSILMAQPALIQRIIECVKLTDNRQHDTPALAGNVLHKDPNGQPRKTDFHYRSAIGQMNFITGSTRPEMQMAVHQCARFSNDPKLSHEQAVKRIVRYLKRTKDEGLILRPDPSKSLECYVDADFAGAWNQEYSDDATNCLSRTGYVIKYAGCPILWQSKLQSTIALSTTEAEFIALSTALRDVIYVMQLLEELISFGVPIPLETPKVFCKVFEDNVGALELARTPRMRPRTKHIGIQYHHFRDHVESGKITIEHVSTKEQIADIFTKPLPLDAFKYLRYKLCGW